MLCKNKFGKCDTFESNKHCVKSVCIRSFYSKYGHFSRSEKTSQTHEHLLDEVT